MEGRHPPVVAPPWSFISAGQRRANHDRIGTTCDGFGDVATGPHPAVGNHVDVSAGLVEMPDPGPGGIGDGGRLGDTNPEHTARCAGGSGPDSDQHPGGAGSHEMEGGAVGGAAPDHHGNLDTLNERGQVERLDPGGNVLGRNHRPLDDQISSPPARASFPNSRTFWGVKDPAATMPAPLSSCTTMRGSGVAS